MPHGRSHRSGGRGGRSGLSQRPTISPAPSKPTRSNPFEGTLEQPVPNTLSDFLDRATFGIISPGLTFESPTLPTIPDPSAPLESQVDSFVDKTNSALSLQELTESLENAPLPFAARESLKQFQLEKQAELDQIARDIEILEGTQTAYQENWQFDNALLESLGLPATVESAREDPEVASAIDAVRQAIDSGEGLDQAIDQMAELGEDELEDLQQAYGRDWYMAQLQTSIRNQMHNLVDNRQSIERQMIDYEQWLKKEAQAQDLNLWDYQGDPSPEGRGLDTTVNDVEQWLNINYNGIVSDAQWQSLATVINAVWTQPEVLSEEEAEDPETGEPVERPVVSEQMKANLMQFATTGLPDQGLTGLGLSPGKAAQFVEQVVAAVERGRETAFAVNEWKNADFLEPGSAEAFAAFAEVAEDVYQDPETAEQMAKSDFMHRLVLMRSGGKVNFEGSGNQFGLFALPEHTYERMGYSVEDLKDNPEAQIEAFLEFVGYWGGYGPGYEGLQAAVADLMHNPDTWGDV